MKTILYNLKKDCVFIRGDLYSSEFFIEVDVESETTLQLENYISFTGEPDEHSHKPKTAILKYGDTERKILFLEVNLQENGQYSFKCKTDVNIINDRLVHQWYSYKEIEDYKRKRNGKYDQWQIQIFLGREINSTFTSFGLIFTDVGEKLNVLLRQVYEYFKSGIKRDLKGKAINE